MLPVPAAAGLVFGLGPHHVNLSGIELYGNEGEGFLSEEESQHIVIDRAYVHDNCCDPRGIYQAHGIYLQGADHRVSNSLIVNHVRGFGIHVYDYARRVLLVNNTVHNFLFSAILIGGNGIGPEGSGVRDVEIVNNVGTHAIGNGYWGVQCYQHPSDYRIHGNLFYDRLTVSNCAVLGVDNVLADPLYVNGFHLGDGSPGIDSGDNAFMFSPDLEGVSRPQGIGVDRGTYER